MNREEVLEIVRGCSSPVAAINTLIAKGRCHAILEAAKIIDRLNKENNIFTGRRREFFNRKIYYYKHGQSLQNLTKNRESHNI